MVLSASFKSQDPKKLACELQDHVKKVTAPYKYPRKASKHDCIKKNNIPNTCFNCGEARNRKIRLSSNSVTEKAQIYTVQEK